MMSVFSCSQNDFLYSPGVSISLPKDTIKGSLAFKPGFQINIRNSPVCIFQKRGSIVQPDLIKILIKIRMKNTGKDFG